MENNLSGTCMTYAKFSSIKRTCFKEIDRKICCNSRSVNTWLRHPRSLLIREWSKCSLFCCSSFTPNEEQFSLANFLPSPRFLIPRNEKGDWAERRTGENTVYQDVKNGQETGGDTVITMEVGQSSECCFPIHIRSEHQRVRTVVRERRHLIEWIDTRWNLLATGSWTLAGCRPV